ncbi:MAG: ATP-binding cassette domain-containing protein [Bacteroidota bacterium]
MEIIRVENVSKQYAAHKALDDVSLSVPEQSIYGLLGPNGAGKTTLIRIINQITGPDTGRILFKGEAFKPQHIYKIGYLPEERGLYKKMKVGEQAVYLAQLKGMKKSEAVKKLKEWFEIFDIGIWWNKKVEELSKGMQQKVQFIVTVLHEPELLIFDEPFSGFDPINTNIIKNAIFDLKKKGSTIILSTHDMPSVEELCDNIALINKSKKILEGPVMDIRKAYRTNTFEVEFEGTENNVRNIVSNKFEVVYSHDIKGTVTARIQLSEGNNANDLLMSLIPHIQIISFREMIPSMNDVFIHKVQGCQENQPVAV